MTSPSLFAPLQLGPYSLDHRVVMAPLTRMRAALPGNVPQAMAVTYYEQRASRGGLIVTEGSQISPGAQGRPATPGIYSPEQVAGWKQVTDAVHAKGGLIYLQLWHCGRVSHSSYHDGALPVAPSAIPAAGDPAVTANFQFADYEIPRALETDEIPGVVESYAEAARNALKAGFDGVEIHGANGYLLEQFLQQRSNQRTDAYGGSIENRARLMLEVTQAVAGVWGAERVGIRLSPFGISNGSGEDDPLPLYTYLIQQLDKGGYGYLHLIEPRASGAGHAEVDHKEVPSASELFRPYWSRCLIAAGNYRRDTADAVIARGQADAIAFGRLFIANPDLPERLKQDAPLNPYDRSTFYIGGSKGYIDYPYLGTEASL